MPRRTDLFTTIRTEGALLPSDLLSRIAESDSRVPGLKPIDYHLNANERIGEMINRSWNRAMGAWAAFNDALRKIDPNDQATTVTRERWLLVLFEELGFGRLQPVRSIEVGNRPFPVSHEWSGKVPIHLVGARLNLDRRTPGVVGAARSSPHSLIQELLNASPERLWGVVSNGLLLRLLRDSAAMTRQAYVEFDLAAMMQGQVYADFVLLWLLLHESRFEGEVSECWLERWAREAEAQGTRALDQLRNAVEGAILALGRGFLSHPANTQLREQLRTGDLGKQDYYRELLRLVYRLLFLFVAEARGLLLEPNASPAAQERYVRYYSVDRLRRISERRRGTQHADLFESLKVLMRALDQAGSQPLGLSALGSFLWSTGAIPNLGTAQISNRDFLAAVQSLAFTAVDKVRRPVDFRNLGAEELGSVYESLLELHPEMNGSADSFSLATAGGHERRATGSYYTPTPIISALLDETLSPLLDRASREANPEKALLRLKILDPACGSGHFLVAAAHRIAKGLAAARTGDNEPAPEAVRGALREVIAHCIYGIDLNEMAVELCKVSLWMEALEPGKPLAFLDHRILNGNAVVGTTPALVESGVPDGAYGVVEGDDRTIAAAQKRRNEVERAGQASLGIDRQPDAAAEAIAELDALGDETLDDVREKERRYVQLQASSEVATAKLLADAWCAAFFAPKAPGMTAITTAVLYQLGRQPETADPAVLGLIKSLVQRYRFHHPHLAFPDVFSKAASDSSETEFGWSGGFDLVLGNPPWNALSPDAKEFFSEYEPQVRFLDREGQQDLTNQLLADPMVAARWASYRRDLFAAVHFFKNSGRYHLYAPGNLGKGDFNIYRMFIEAAMQLARPGGSIGQVVPSGFYSGANCMAIRKQLLEHWQWSLLLGFTNTREVWFPGIDSRTTFCIYVAKKSGSTNSLKVSFGISSGLELARMLAGGTLTLPVAVIVQQSPVALAVPEVTNERDARSAAGMYSQWPSFGDEAAGPPMRRYMRELDMGVDRKIFEPDRPGFPVYEGRMVEAFDYRAKGYRSGRGRKAVWAPLEWGADAKSIQPQWWVRPQTLPRKLTEQVTRYRIGFCDVTSPTNERTLMAALIPPGTVCGDKVPTISFPQQYEWAYMVWLAVANSFTMDFLARKKVALKMSYTVLDSLPFPRLHGDHPLVRTLLPPALSLSCVGPEMVNYWNSMAEAGWCDPAPAGTVPSGMVDTLQRELARADLDARVAKYVFELGREELSAVLDTFPIVRSRDEKLHGDFRTKRIILESFDMLPSRPGRQDMAAIS